jgi:hypothetical protein
MKEFKPKGYHTPSGYLGLIGNGKWRLFDTEKEYDEYVITYIKEEEKDNGSSKEV